MPAREGWQEREAKEESEKGGARVCQGCSGGAGDSRRGPCGGSGWADARGAVRRGRAAQAGRGLAFCPQVRAPPTATVPASAELGFHIYPLVPRAGLRTVHSWPRMPAYEACRVRARVTHVSEPLSPWPFCPGPSRVGSPQ